MPIQAKLIAVLVSVALLVGGVALAYQRGYTHGYDIAHTQGDDTLKNDQLANEEAMAKAVKAANDQFVAAVNRANSAEQALLAVRDQLAQQSQHAKEQIDVVTQTYRLALGAPPQALPRCVFTRGFVRLWNTRAGADDGNGTLPASATASGADPAPDITDSLDSGVSQADVLDWLIDYSDRSRSIESQLNQLLDVEQGNLQAQP